MSLSYRKIVLSHKKIVLSKNSTCKYLLFQHKQHSDKYIDQPEQDRVYGVHTFYRQEIERIR